MGDGSEIEMTDLEGIGADPNVTQEQRAQRLAQLEAQVVNINVITGDDIPEELRADLLRLNNLKEGTSLTSVQINERDMLQAALIYQKIIHNRPSEGLSPDEVTGNKKALSEKQNRLDELSRIAKDRTLDADEASEKMRLEVEVEKLKNPPVQEKPPEEVGLENYNKAKTEGHLGKFEVVEELDHGGTKALRLKDPDTGKTFILKVGVEKGKLVGAGMVPDFEPGWSEAELRKHVEENIIEYYEGNYRLLTRPLIEAYANNIGAYPNTAISAELRVELKDRLEQRLYLAMAAYNTDMGMVDQFQDTFATFGRPGLEYIGVTMERENVHVKKMVHELEINDGEFYRMDTRDARNKRDAQILFGTEDYKWDYNSATGSWTPSRVVLGAVGIAPPPAT